MTRAPDGDPITVLVADDQEMVRAGFGMILAAEPGIEMIGEAANGRQAVARSLQLRPDVVLMDIRMPVLDGLAATAELTSRGPATCRVVILTTFDDDAYVYRALEAGASAFLLKDAPAADLVHAIRVVALGDAVLAPTVTRRLIAEFSRRRVDDTASRLVAGLTDREREVLRLMADGLSNTEIAERLVVGEATVKTHVGRNLHKLGARDRVQAVILAHRSGLAYDPP